MSLVSLAYTSAALREPTSAELKHLLERAQQRNAEHQVTGVLLYSQGAFMQCIEGPPASIEFIFDVIRADRMHHQVTELFREPIEEREFAQWSMALRTTSGSHMSWGGPVLSERLTVPPGPCSQARLLLSSFWGQGFGTRYNGLLAARL